MAIAAGHAPTGGELNALQSRVQYAAASSSLGLSATETDIPGATMTVTVSGSNAYCTVQAVFDVLSTVTASNNVFQGRCRVGSTTLSGESHTDDRQSRATCAGLWQSGLSPGSNTVKLRACCTGGTMSTQPVHTIMIVTIWDVP